MRKSTLQFINIDSTRFRPVECCGLESLLIELKKEDKKMHNKNLIYIPPCVRVNRCGGCCNTQGYSCESNGFMETINISVNSNISKLFYLTFKYFYFNSSTCLPTDIGEGSRV